MDRISSDLVYQLIKGIKLYCADSLEDFIKSKDMVEHGRKGIVVYIEGNYALSVRIEKNYPEGLALVGFNDGLEFEGLEVITFNGVLEKFPYTNKGLDLSINSILFQNSDMSIKEEKKKTILTPFIYYNSKMDNCGDLVKFSSCYGSSSKDDEVEINPFLAKLLLEC